MPFPLQMRLITPTTFNTPTQTNQWEKRPRPTALCGYMRHLDRVGRFPPNPALPTDQPLRGRWRTTTNLYVGSYKFAAIPKLLYNKHNQN